MSSPGPPNRDTSLPRRRAEYGFQPRMALGIVYILVLFFGYAMLLVLPELLEVLETVPQGPEQERVAREVAHQSLGWKIYLAMGGAIVTVLLGARYQVLPGMRPPADS